jgi:hypothetical protein
MESAWRLPSAAAAITRLDHLFPLPPLLLDLAHIDGTSFGSKGIGVKSRLNTTGRLPSGLRAG